MKVTNCNCGKLVDCGCTLTFDEYLSPALSVLSIGNLLGGSCVLDEYVIDWYRNGNKEVISGVGTDPDIQVYHPFTGISAVPVLPGNWVPVVRYIVVDGVQLFNEKKNCKDWCLWISDLPVVIVVNPLTCDSVNDASAPYNYKVSYTNTQDYALAYRRFALELDPDLSIHFVAMQFTGQLVADKLEVFWNTDTEPIFSIICGNDAGSYQFDTMPYLFRGSSGYRFVLPIGGYSAGDYLRFEVTPSVMSSNTNTNWIFEIACIDDPLAFNCDFYTVGMRTITSLNVVDNPTLCRTELEITTSEQIGILNGSHPMYNWSRFLNWSVGGLQSSYDGITFRANNSYSTNYQAIGWFGGPDFNVRVNSNAAINIAKTGNVTVITCIDQDDYDSYYDGYSAIMSGDYMSTYSSDPLSIAHYRRIIAELPIASPTCGDSLIPINLNIHPSATVVFDSVLKTITITTSLLTNELPNLPCDNSYSSADSIVAMCNVFHNLADFNYNTNCRMVTCFSYGLGISSTPQTPTVNYTNHYRHAKLGYAGLPCLLEEACANSPAPYLAINPFYLLTQYTGVPRTENYKVSSYTNINGCYTGVPVLIYEVVNGVVVTNNLPYHGM